MARMDCAPDNVLADETCWIHNLSWQLHPTFYYCVGLYDQLFCKFSTFFIKYTQYGFTLCRGSFFALMTHWNLNLSE